ncbi:hypothetical protein LC653_34695 [Nostoc sp. CHAB 5784]|uniref:hypothetical protein n=1 Tax=Nostoc mirabile TaxID=2907820 RepID=UPI001E3DC7F0|nr:hypothetical protein [Nostoc mirabile]MCC5668868.1 hypothetical protein [Nostoc mirabile CHAB5784]
MKVGIAMVPSAQMNQYLVELQKEVMSFCSLRPLLGTEFNLPHITLLQGLFKNNLNWFNLISDLRDYCTQQKYSLEFKLSGLEYQPPGWYFLTLSPNIIFGEAHRFVFERLKDSMYLTEEDRQKDTTNYSTLEKENYFKYGHRYIGDAFYPHITLGRSIDKSRIQDEAYLINTVKVFTSNIVGTIQKITIYEMGENGSHANTLYYVNI